MVVLRPNQPCPFGSFCIYTDDFEGKCRGLDPNRQVVFICELWAENYSKKELEDAKNHGKLL